MSDQLTELFNRKEDLCLELDAYLEKEGVLGRCIRHPLIYCLFYHPDMNAFLNAQLKAKTEVTVEAFNNKNWHRYVWLHEKPYRLNAFKQIEENLDDSEYWKFLSALWMNSENIWQNQKLWKKFLNSKRKEFHYFMSEEDRTTLEGLPNELTVYRGCNPKLNKNGMSYTLNPAIANKFANRLSQYTGILVTKKIKKSQILAYLNGRDEEEIILL